MIEASKVPRGSWRFLNLFKLSYLAHVSTPQSINQACLFWALQTETIMAVDPAVSRLPDLRIGFLLQQTFQPTDGAPPELQVFPRSIQLLRPCDAYDFATASRSSQRLRELVGLVVHLKQSRPGTKLPHHLGVGFSTVRRELARLRQLVEHAAVQDLSRCFLRWPSRGRDQLLLERRHEQKARVAGDDAEEAHVNLRTG